MKLFLAGTSVLGKLWGHGILEKSPYILESYYYWQDWQEEQMKSSEMFVADSGAFSYMSGIHDGDIAEFTKGYMKFLRRYDIRHYMEMDVDCMIGLEKVEYLRKKIEDYIGRPSIPVFHFERGADYWHKMCEEYDYVAIGTGYDISAEIMRKMCTVARKYGTRVHGLGYTRKDAEDIGFWSVDSSSWSCARFGQLVRFNGEWIENVNRGNCRLIHGFQRNSYHNVQEWIKLQKFLQAKESNAKIFL